MLLLAFGTTFCEAPQPFATADAGAGFERSKINSRTEFVPVRVAGTGDDGLPVIEPVANGGAASLFQLSLADGMCIIPAGRSVSHGRRLAWRPFS